MAQLVVSPPNSPITKSPATDCPSVAQIALAAAGQLEAADQMRVVTHVNGCQPCAQVRNQLTEKLAHWAGRFLYKGHLTWTRDWNWLKPYEKHLHPDAARGQLKTRIIDRRFTLAQFAKSVRLLRGSTAECGVLGGVGSAMICRTLEHTYRDDETHYGFDSFEGLSEPVAVDRSPHAWQQKGSLAISPQVAQENLADFAFCTLVKGWIPACFEPARHERFRLAHIDLDLYQPTLDSLDFFYSRMNPGGAFVFDDYGHLTCLGVRQAVDEFFADKPERVLESVDGIAYCFKV
ncbi:MAG TPA: TylF/MycF/NovP-related O-methyltransferase [Pirellulales bacterium]|jgi:hypothetical protein|nr:TylF/MycF/NovP-related O-methyltransferase [Pirellulales bacterium]